MKLFSSSTLLQAFCFLHVYVSVVAPLAKYPFEARSRPIERALVLMNARHTLPSGVMYGAPAREPRRPKVKKITELVRRPPFTCVGGIASEGRVV
mmetsp:Transcript_88084/g.161581  ORF Transcript_88084/g.161581 Transcript_88084/m.161581 type:complete len:95 (-) Transcript_88084:2254-2538(-)